ncbi:MAG: DUF2975 domain-containing protein [Oscillospiraceae bacterium]|nr:DUF2975 domain-containing protein [Oscillospiraceae bacterium]
MENKKLINTAKGLDTFVKVAGTIFKVCSIICAIFAVLVLIFGSKMYDVSTLTLELDYVTLKLADSFQLSEAHMKAYAVTGLLVVACVCFLVSYIAVILRKILVPMKEGRPFEADIPANLRKIAWVSLIAGIIAQAAGIAERVLLTFVYPMDDIFSSALISDVEYNFNFDFTFVLIFLVILFLSYIFSYGQKLQQESDETL